MKFRILIPLLAVGLAGCGSTDSSQSTVPIQRQLSARVADYANPSSLGISNGRKQLNLGNSLERAFAVFPTPSRGFPMEEAVPGFPNGFKSKGWETATEGFGVIVRDDQVFLAMRQYEQMDADGFAELLEQIQTGTPGFQYERLALGTTESWFTSDGTDQLVILRSPTKRKQRYQVTVALGHAEIMAALGLSKYSTASTIPMGSTQ